MKRDPKITLGQFAQTIKTPALSRFDNQVVTIYDYIVKMNMQDEALRASSYIHFKYFPPQKLLEVKISNQLFSETIFHRSYFQHADIATTIADWRTMKNEMLRIMFTAKTIRVKK